ncbi:hypothetical protein JYT83_00850 [bacterium AH-315-F18]|nr:hypothetical protein [bacterium AH-315-F18]
MTQQKSHGDQSILVGIFLFGLALLLTHVGVTFLIAESFPKLPNQPPVKTRTPIEIAGTDTQVEDPIMKAFYRTAQRGVYGKGLGSSIGKTTTLPPQTSEFSTDIPIWVSAYFLVGLLLIVLGGTLVTLGYKRNWLASRRRHGAD